MSLENRVAIVTGASSGIGRGVAERLAEDGANVVVADLRREPKRGEHFQTDVTTPTHQLLTEEHGVDSVFVGTDTADSASVESMVEATIDEFGHLDILINCAGIQRLGTSQETSVAEYDRVVDVNLNGYFYAAKYAIPHLRESDQGRIVNVSSINARFGGGGASYAASKAGEVNMTRDLAVEVADAGVTVNAVLPGVVETAMQDQNDEETRRRQSERTPLPRIGEPADVANAVRFFASGEAEWITGAELLVDGGYLAGGY